MEQAALAMGDRIEHPPGSLRDLAQVLLLKGHGGDTAAIKETADRLDGKPPQTVAGDPELPPVLISWLTDDEEDQNGQPGSAPNLGSKENPLWNAVAGSSVSKS